MSEQRPGSGFLGWLGRQIGYVRGAVKKDVTKTVVHRASTVEEAQLTDRPDVKLRRTVIDEVIIDKEEAAKLRERNGE